MTGMKIRYCCEFPNTSLFLDDNGGPTAVVFCTGCQTIVGEIYLDTGEPTAPFQEGQQSLTEYTRKS